MQDAVVGRDKPHANGARVLAGPPWAEDTTWQSLERTPGCVRQGVEALVLQNQAQAERETQKVRS